MLTCRSILKKLAWCLVVACLFCIAVLSLVWLFLPGQIVSNKPFVVQSLDIDTYDWYDLGTVDLNRDGHLDIFTTNHSNMQSLLIADGKGAFEDNLTRYGLNQDTDFPGLEALDVAPDMSQPGIYIYFLQAKLYLTHVTGNHTSSITGSISIPIQVKIISDKGFEAEILNKTSAGYHTGLVTFNTTHEGQLTLEVPISAPITVNLKSNVQLENVFVGFNRINPKNHNFELYLKDRHGIAWSDFNNDSMKDAFIVRGGLFGQMSKVSRELSDQFFLSLSSDQYIDVIKEKGFSKKDSPGRKVAWVDVNGDGRLDLYISCGRKVGGFWQYVPEKLRKSTKTGNRFPNMLYLQKANGKFQEVAGSYGLDFDVGGTFLWYDPDRDGDADLLWASENEVVLYRNSNVKFTAEVLLPESTTIQPVKLAAADFDSDDDLDVFIGASFGSKLLINDSGNLRVVNPEDFGLPSRVRTVNWVDFNNDGQMDLYAWPAGIYQQEDNGHFRKTGLLNISSPFWPLVDARALWFDYDNDGDLDVIIMQRFFPRIIQKAFHDRLCSTAIFLRNDSDPENHWFQVELEGMAGNREAIGASVTVSTSRGHHRQEVGQFESSHFSQGHYRLHFGLGTEVEPNAINVHWSDDLQQSVTLPVNRQIIRLAKPM